MDAIEKFIKRLTEKERSMIDAAMQCLMSGAVQGMNIKRLCGSTDLFRVRVGNFRIIYYDFGENLVIVAISRRNENTYKK